jgi:mRNA interferase MazF
MTTGSKPAPYRISLRFRGKNGLVLLDQIRTLDKTRLAGRLGAVKPKTLHATLDALRQMSAD